MHHAHVIYSVSQNSYYGIQYDGHLGFLTIAFFSPCLRHGPFSEQKTKFIDKHFLSCQFRSKFNLALVGVGNINGFFKLNFFFSYQSPFHIKL